jgi:hypothetical protein
VSGGNLLVDLHVLHDHFGLQVSNFGMGLLQVFEDELDDIFQILESVDVCLEQLVQVELALDFVGTLVGLDRDCGWLGRRVLDLLLGFHLLSNCEDF